LLLLLLYFLVHLFREPTHTPWTEEPLSIDQVDFSFELRAEKLRSYFSEADLQDMRAGAGALAERFREKSKAWRNTNLSSLRDFLNRTYENHPFRVAGDKTLFEIDLEALRKWLESDQLQTVREKRGTLESWMKSLDERIGREAGQREQMQALIGAYEPPLYFDWLWHEGAGWVFEVTMWSLIGVIANTLIGLITAKKDETYRINHFLLTIPKFVLAPVLSIVVVALWSSGFSESSISILNLPYFLVLSFLLGFGTETLYERIRDLVKAILGPTTKFSEKKAKEAGRANLASLLEWRSLPPPANKEELRERLESAITAEGGVALREELEDSQ
jgi:hypothetical protein